MFSSSRVVAGGLRCGLARGRGASAAVVVTRWRQSLSLILLFHPSSRQQATSSKTASQEDQKHFLVQMSNRDDLKTIR